MIVLYPDNCDGDGDESTSACREDNKVISSPPNPCNSKRPLGHLTGGLLVIFTKGLLVIC